jgi:hypothetical protein
LKENKLFSKFSKCVFGQQQVEYLAHIISELGVATDLEKIKVVQDWPEPSTLIEPRSFLGLSGYYRRFIKDYGKIYIPLFDSLKRRILMGSTKYSGI